MAHARGGRTNRHLPGSRRIDLHVLDLQSPRRLPQYGSFHGFYDSGERIR